MRQLDFQPIKTDGQFKENYRKHDIALGLIKSYFHQRHFKIIDYGPDRRNERIWGDDRPDIIIWRNGYLLAFVDCKGHLGANYILNERAYNTYLKYSKIYQIPIIITWVILDKEEIYYDEIPFRNPLNDFMPHDGNKVIKTEDVKHINNLIKRLKIQMF